MSWVKKQLIALLLASTIFLRRLSQIDVIIILLTLFKIVVLSVEREIIVHGLGRTQNECNFNPNEFHLEDTLGTVKKSSHRNYYKSNIFY